MSYIEFIQGSKPCAVVTMFFPTNKKQTCHASSDRSPYTVERDAA